MLTLWIRKRLVGRRIERATQKHLHELQRGPSIAAQSRAKQVLAEMRNQPGTKVYLGKTPWNEDVKVPLIDMVKACGLTTGAMGSGKTMAALLPIAAMLQQMPNDNRLSFGVLDPKGELFERALYLIHARASQLKDAEREALLRRVVVIDFSSKEALTPYNILAPWSNAERDFFITSRSETLRELLPSGEKLSLRGANVLKHILLLLADFKLPLTYFEAVLSNDELRQQLVSRTKDLALRTYFNRHFVIEGKQTIAALRAKINPLFDSDSVKLALSGSSAPDFCRLQNEGQIVLINCAGPMITRGVRLLLQGLVLSDIRQSIFARPKEPPVTYLWCCDEAQNFFVTKQQATEMTDVLTMARSFGSFFYFLCQNLTASVADAHVLEQLHTNIRWTLTLRGTPRDAQFLRAALPVTGRMPKPDANPYRAERSMYSPEEERSLALDGITHLPDREGYLWLKTRSPEAIRLQTAVPLLPKQEAFREEIERLRNDASLGQRLSRAAYIAEIEKRDRAWLGSEPGESLEERFEQTYKEQEAVWQSS